MRRRWPALAATIPLVLGWAVATAHPASASAPATGPAAVQPGGPVSSLSTPGMPAGTVTPQISGQQPQGGQGGGGQGSGQGGGLGGLGGGLGSGQSGGAQNSVVTSSNWAGYVASGRNGTFTSASSNWTEPVGHCTGAGGKYAAFWVGLDGYTSSTVEQIGSEVDCSGIFPEYYAWYEVYPGAAVNFTNPVSAGDQFTGTVTYTAPSTFKLVLTDHTKNWTQTVSATVPSAARSSAEVIAEAPCCTAGDGILPLTDFGTVSFNSATANGRSMATGNPTEIVMPDTFVSPMNSAGNFIVSYAGFRGFPGFPARPGGAGPVTSASD
jgi:peptidase A4-like protein